MSARDIEEAATVNCHACDFCPSVHIDLFDADGERFASANLPAELVDEFVRRMLACKAELATRSSAPVRRQ